MRLSTKTDYVPISRPCAFASHSGTHFMSNGSAEMRAHGIHDYIINEALEAMTGITLREFATGTKDGVTIDQACFKKLLELDNDVVRRALGGRLVIPDWQR